MNKEVICSKNLRKKS